MRIRVPKKLFWGLVLLPIIGLGVGIYLASPGTGRLPEQDPALKDLDELSRLAHGRTDKGFPGHWYTEAYERLLRPWKNEPIRLLEIGIASGGSLLMWQDYFPNASIFGIDIAESSRFENARVRTCIADQSKREQLGTCLAKFGGQFDLLIDDGGHTMEQQQVSLGFLFPYVRPGGFYSIEDLHTSMPDIYPGFEVEPGAGNSTLSMIFGYIRTAPPVFQSKYMLPDEIAHLNAEVETIDFHLANNQGHSMMCVFKKRRPAPVAKPSATSAAPAPGAPDNTTSPTKSTTAVAPETKP